MEAAREQGRGHGSVRPAFWLSWSLAGLCVAMFLATYPLFVLARSAHIPGSWNFNPLKGRIQYVNFYRRKYDAKKMLEEFGARLRDETDLDSLGEDLLGVVRETVRTARVSLWLQPPGRPYPNEESRRK